MASILLPIVLRHYNLTELEITNRVAYYTFNFVMTSAIPLLFANTCRFIMFQIVKEKETLIYQSLCTLNMSSLAYALSYMAIQLPNCLFTALLLALSNIIIIDESRNVVMFFVSIFLFGIAMIIFSLTITTLFNDSKFST